MAVCVVKYFILYSAIHISIQFNHSIYILQSTNNTTAKHSKFYFHILSYQILNCIIMDFFPSFGIVKIEDNPAYVLLSSRHCSNTKQSRNWTTLQSHRFCSTNCSVSNRNAEI